MSDLTGIGEASTAIKSILGMFFTDKTVDEQAKIAQAMQILQMQNDSQIAQIKANTAASSNGVTFRDGAGWVCVTGIGLQVLKPVIEWLATLAGHPIVLPQVDTSATTSMLLGLLGLGAMHMNESIKTA